MKNGKNIHKTAYLFFAIALLVRLFRLSNQSLWLDEAVIFSQISQGSLSAMFGSIEGHLGPVFHLLQYYFSAVFGYSEFALRFPAAIYGAFSVVLLLLISVKLFSYQVSVIGTALFCFSPLHIWYSQESRMYSLWVLLILLLSFLFIELLKNNQLKLWLAFTATAIISMWTYLNTAFFLIALGLFLLLYIKQYKQQFFAFSISMIFTIAAYSPGIIAFAHKKSMSIGSVRPTGLADLAYSFLVFSFGTSFGAALTEIRQMRSIYGAETIRILLMQYGWYVLPLLLIVLALVVFSIHKLFKAINRERFVLFSILLFVPSMLIFLIAFLLDSVPFNVRYILCSLPFFCLLLGFGIYRLPKKLLKPVVLVIVCTTFFSLSNHYFNPHYHKADMKAALAMLQEKLQAPDKALIYYEHARPLLAYYNDSRNLAQNIELAQNVELAQNIELAQNVGLAKYYVPIDSTAKKTTEAIKGQNVYLLKSVRVQEYKRGMIDQVQKSLEKKLRLCEKYEFTKVEIFYYCGD